MYNPKEELTRLMVHYFKKGTDHWDYDNTSEVHTMVELIDKIIEDKVVEMMDKGMSAYKPEPPSDLAITFRTLMREAWKRCGEPDDAGCDWFTDEQGNTYIGSAIWKVSSDPQVAQIVETAYLIRHGENVRHTMEEIEKMVLEEKKNFEEMTMLE